MDPKYLKLIPQNVDATINAPKSPSPQRINSSDIIGATHVTTEFNTLLETVVSVAHGRAPEDTEHRPRGPDRARGSHRGQVPRANAQLCSAVPLMS